MCVHVCMWTTDTVMYDCWKCELMCCSNILHQLQVWSQVRSSTDDQVCWSKLVSASLLLLFVFSLFNKLSIELWEIIVIFHYFLALIWETTCRLIMSCSNKELPHMTVDLKTKPENRPGGFPHINSIDTQLNPMYRCMRALREHQRTRSPPPPALQYGWKKATAGPPSCARRALRRPCSHMRTPSRSSSRTRVRSRLR